MRRGTLGVRVRAYHQSSHLGDELLLREPAVTRVNLSFEALDALVSWEHGGWRLYGGGGYLSGQAGVGGLDPWELQWGLEMRGGTRSVGGLEATPVLGADFKSFQQQRWALNTSIAAGVEWRSSASGRRVRLLVAFRQGFSPYGQFFSTERIRNVGLQAQFEL